MKEQLSEENAIIEEVDELLPKAESFISEIERLL